MKTYPMTKEEAIAWEEDQVANKFLDGGCHRDALDSFYDSSLLRPSEAEFKAFYDTLGLPARFYSIMMEIVELNYTWSTQEELDEFEKEWPLEE
tara:strand:- start:1157 stop:1438 length:282 start_codon:yes stop_codon:yes gene_type:complete